jgi:hypothetical protein
MVDADVSSPAELHGQWELAGGDAVVDLELTPLADRPGVLEGSFLAGESGSYTVRVLPGGPAEPDMAARPATLTLRVEPPRQEIDNPTLDKLLLEEIAQVSGGAIFTLTNADELPAAIQVRQVERVLEYRDEVWDAPLLSGLIVLLLTAEWLLRKKHRMA